MPLFSQRHYEWLARFAALNLDYPARAKLLLALETDNPKFNYTRFNRAVLSHRNATREAAREAALERASLPPANPLPPID